MQTPGQLVVLVAPSGFKESIGPRQVAEAIAAGVEVAAPTARVIRLPLIDGGEGFTEEVVRRANGVIEKIEVSGPFGEPATGRLGMVGGVSDRLAVIEIADAAGLWLMPRARRDPTRASSAGVGELIRAALDRGVSRILIGCGDSGVNDGGIGMAAALGVRFIGADGGVLGTAGELAGLAAIDREARDPRLEGVRIDVVVNPCNRLLGPQGVSRVYGPQKGATPAQVELLEAGLGRLAALLRDTTGLDVAAIPGSGASGGLGAGLLAFAGARLVSRFDFAQQHFAVDEALAVADLVVTAEGSIDGQTALGKMPAWVAQQAKLRGLPVIALAGRLGEGADRIRTCGVDVLMSIAPGPCSRDEALANTALWLRRASASAMALIAVGRRLEGVGAAAKETEDAAAAAKEARQSGNSSRASCRRESQETPEKPLRRAREV